MIGTLTLPPATFLKFSRGNNAPLEGSRRKLSIGGRNSCNTVIQSVAKTAALVDVNFRSPRSLYELLGVKRNASAMEIKTAYRRLAKVYHPDASHSLESDGVDFIELHNAYATLSDPTARGMYDLTLSRGYERRSFGYWNDGSDYMFRFHQTRRWETDQCW